MWDTLGAWNWLWYELKGWLLNICSWWDLLPLRRNHRHCYHCQINVNEVILVSLMLTLITVRNFFQCFHCLLNEEMNSSILSIALSACVALSFKLATIAFFILSSSLVNLKNIWSCWAVGRFFSSCLHLSSTNVCTVAPALFRLQFWWPLPNLKILVLEWQLANRLYHISLLSLFPW